MTFYTTDLPRNCGECPLAVKEPGEPYYCAIDHYAKIEYYKKSPDCPLQPLPKLKEGQVACSGCGVQIIRKYCQDCGQRIK